MLSGRSSKPTRIFTARIEQVKPQSSPARGTTLGVFVPIWLVLPRCEATVWVCLICVIPPHSSGAVQIRVGLELADGAGVLARGVLRPVRGQAAWEYHEPGTPPSHSPKSSPVQGIPTTKFLVMCSLSVGVFPSPSSRKKEHASQRLDINYMIDPCLAYIYRWIDR